MNNIWTFNTIYDQFLTYARSCTFADLADEEIESELEKFLLRAVAEFRFPQCSLDYEPGEWQDGNATVETYQFTDEKFGQREVNVILGYMKKYFMEWLLTREKNFEQQYYDADTKTHSQGAIVRQLNSAYKTAIKEAHNINYNYTRMDTEHRAPRIGQVNE